MSHSKQRKEKNCLNCNAVVNGRYCSICGQENLEPTESLWNLIIHFFNDITHFDGKFFSSVKYIFTKPGFLSAEYMSGRRMSYLNPIRFYIFTSFVFFLLLFSVFLKKDVIENNFIIADNDSETQQLKNIEKKPAPDSLKINASYNKVKLDSLKINTPIKSIKKDSGIFKLYQFRDRKEYDSLNKIGKINYGKIAKVLIEKQFQLQEKYKDDPQSAKEAMLENILHLIPQVLFFTLPFFAFVLKLLYLRKKRIFYTSHLIFTIHIYIFVYLQLLLINFLSLLAAFKYFHFLNTVNFILGWSIIFYVYAAMRTFYEQSKWKTLFKILILCTAFFVITVFFILILFGLSIFKM